jgi:threonine dehydrogenase-like Zn-dependent dehydrogenase
VVSEIGPAEVTDGNGEVLAPGDRVMWASSVSCGRCAACARHREPTLCTARRTYGVNRTVTGDSGPTGSWAESIRLHRGVTVVKLPDQVDALAAMSLACAGPTIVHALLERWTITAGDVVIVQGSGPVGLAAAALAQLSGARRVIILGGPANRLALAKDIGVGTDHLNVIDGDREAALAEAVRLTGGGADVVVECAGVPAAVAQGLRLARRGGAYVVVGQYTDSGDTLLNPHQIVHRQLTVVGSWAFTGSHLVAYVNLLPQLTERFDLARMVSVFPLAEVDEAMRAVRAAEVVKAVVRPG